MRKLIFILCLITSPVWAQTIPANNGKYIMDTANVLGTRQLNDINEKLANIEKNVTDHPQVVALIVNTAGEMGIDDFATKVFEAWKPGTKEKDNGMLLVIATQDHKIAIRTGNGIGYRITDIQTRQITDVMKPSLQAADWYHALIIYADQSFSILKSTQEVSVKKDEQSGGFWSWFIIVSGLILVIWIVYSVFKYNKAIKKHEAEILEQNRKALEQKRSYVAQPVYRNLANKDKRWNQGPGKPKSNTSTVPPSTTTSNDDNFTSGLIGGIIGSAISSSLSDSTDYGSSSISSPSFDSGGGSTDAGGSSDSF